MIPLWIKLAFTLMTAIILVAYWIRYGPANLLWFCDIALVGTTLALWLESALFAATMTVLILVPEVLWILALVLRLTIGSRLFGALDYMFDSGRPLWLRLLSLYHIPLPLVLVWMVWTLGYEPLALPLAMGVATIALVLTRLLAPAQRNINWTHGLGGEGNRQDWFHPATWLLLLMIGAVIVFHLPAHLLLVWLF